MTTNSGPISGANKHSSIGRASVTQTEIQVLLLNKQHRASDTKISGDNRGWVSSPAIKAGAKAPRFTPRFRKKALCGPYKHRVRGAMEELLQEVFLAIRHGIKFFGCLDGILFEQVFLR